jgi:hypothetical protein
MFREAGFEAFEHHVMGPDRNPDVAITTVAEVGGERDRDPDAGAKAEAEAGSGTEATGAGSGPTDPVEQ